MYGAKGAKTAMSKKMDSKTTKVRKAAAKKYGKKKTKAYGG